MTRLIAPNGSTVNVSADRAKRLLGEGYKADDEKSPAKKPAKSGKSEK